MLSDYSDEPGNRGLLVTPFEEAVAVCRAALEADYQVCTHAIGDRGNRMILNAYEEALAAHPGKDHRFRAEHAQILAPGDIQRFAGLGVIPSMQPTHATSDMPWAETRVGADRIIGSDRSVFSRKTSRHRGRAATDGVVSSVPCPRDVRVRC